MALHERVPVIDIGTALDLLAREGLRHPVRHVLSLAGMSDADVDALGDRRIRELHAAGRLPVTLTLGALVVFDAAERAQDRGYGESRALAYIGDVVTRFIEVLPDAAFGTQVVASTGGHAESQAPETHHIVHGTVTND